MVNLTVDDKKVSVAEGTTILKAAESLGISIPTLCYHARISPIGACRLCLVEVEGENRLVASCATPVREGMVVRTNTDEIQRQRKQMLQFVLLNHPLDCPVCDKAGECHVQDITVALGVLEQPFTAIKPDKWKEELSPVLDLWHTRCIMCGRCVQICKEIQGARAIDYVARSGYASRVGPTESGGYPCESCSQCLSMCPVGAILDSTFRYSARAWQLTKVDSICTFCGVGCSHELNVRKDRVFRVTVRDFQGYNKSNLCSLGRFGRDAIHSEARLTSPAIRKNGALQNVSWDDALSYTARRLKEIVSKGDGRSVAGLASARCSNEALFAFQRLMRDGLGTDRIDTPAHLNNHALIETMSDVYGAPAPTATITDIDEADAILVVDSNIVCSHPVATLELLRVHRSGSAKVLVIGHRSNKLSTQCAQFARTLPGSETSLLNCLANLVVSKGTLDDEALERRSDGYNKLKLHLMKYSLPETAAHTGIDADIISEIAEIIVDSKNFLLVLSPGSLHSALNSSIARSAVNLAVLKGGKVLSLLREGNAQGALDMGISPDFLPGYKETATSQDGSAGVSGIRQGVETGELRAVYLMGADIRREAALLGLSQEMFQSIEFLIVQDIFGSPLAEMAHVVLPACSSGERDASYTNAYRIVQHSSRAIPPIGECRSDLEIVSELGHKLGLPAMDSLQAVRSQIASTVPIYEFMDKDPLLKDVGAWDYSKVASAARHKFSIVSESRPVADDAYPYIVTFDNMLHFGGTTSMHSRSLSKIRVDAVVEMSESDANALGAKEGAVVEVGIKGAGSAKLPVRISRELPPRVLSIPAHSYEVIQKLISKIEPPLLRADSAPVWFARMRLAKD